MSKSISSAVPAALTRYAEVAVRIDEDLNVEAARLAAALQTFAATCTEYRTGVNPQLADDLRQYVQHVTPKDAWVRQVAADFQAADEVLRLRAGVSGLSGPVGVAAISAAPHADDAKEGVGDRIGGFFKGAWEKTKDIEDKIDAPVHTALDVAGLVPVVGEAADLANAGYYAAEGDWKNAGISAAGLLPVGGQAATGGRLAINAAEGVADARRAGEAASEAAQKRLDNKILYGRPTDKQPTKLIGAHSPRIWDYPDNYIVESLNKNPDGTEYVVLVKELPDGRVSKLKYNTLAPRSWTDDDILRAGKHVANTPPVATTQTKEGVTKTLHRAIVNGVEWEVIKADGVVTSSYPNGGKPTINFQ